MNTLPAGLALVAAVARELTAGAPVAATLGRVASHMRESLAVRQVVFWHRAPNATAFVAVSDGPPPATAKVPHLDQLPAAAPGVLRVPLVYAGARLGLLELDPGPNGPPPDDGLAAILGDVVAPYLDVMMLSEDLATEVASRTKETEEQRRFTSLIIDSLPVGLYVVDREYRILVWNRKRETGTQGILREDAVGRPVFEVLTRQAEGLLRSEFDRVFTHGEEQLLEIEVEGPERPRHYRLSKIPMRLDGDAVTHVITIGEDITEQRTTEQRIRQSEKLAAIGQLAAGVMHEVNNPLATIGACVAAIEGRLSDVPGALPSVGEYLEIVEKEVHRCTRIVDGLLDFARPKQDAGERTTIDMGALLEQTLFLVKHHQRFKHLEVRQEFTSGLAPVLVNAEQMIQVFMALMLNAADALETIGPGGTRRLTLRTRPHDTRADEVVAEIVDTGGGIAGAELEKIFEPFYTTKPPGRGTGLGLAICYGILEQHRGHIEVESEPGRGSTFRVVLPTNARAGDVP